MNTKNKNIYRIIFANQGKVYEIYAKQVNQSAMLGFVEIEDLLFGEKSSLVIDPVEERLKHEFANTKRTYIPMNYILRIDEVDQQGESKVTKMDGTKENVLSFPANHSGMIPPHLNTNNSSDEDTNE